MTTLSIKDAKEKYFSEGMDDVFTFDEYVVYLARCHIVVVKNETRTRLPGQRIAI